MTTPGDPDTVTLPRASLIHLAEVPTELDGLLRSSQSTTDLLIKAMAVEGRSPPSYDANTMLENISFAALRLRQLAKPTDDGPHA